MGVPRRILRNILLGIPIGITFLDTVGYVARVEGVSMQPALNPNSNEVDYVFLNRWTIRGYKIKRGDIISLSSPKYPNQKLIKRVIGLPGDIVGTIGYKSEYVQVCKIINNQLKILCKNNFYYCLSIFRYRRATAGSKETTQDILWTRILLVLYLWVL